MQDEARCSARYAAQDRALGSRAGGTQRRRRALFPPILLGWLLVIAGCASNYDAPIEQKSALPLRPTAQAAPRAPASAFADRERPTPALHVVASGDKLLTIAWRYGLDVRDLIRWNQITNPDLIVVGQALRLRPPTPPPVLSMRASGLSPAAPAPVAPVTMSGAGYEPVPMVSSPPRINTAPSPATAAPNGLAPNGTAAVASTLKPLAEPATPRAPSDLDSNKVNASKDVAADREGVRWLWPTPGKVSVADASGASKGIDIRGARGQAVKAAAAGAVVYSGSGLRGYGELIIIKHSDTFLSAYAHNEVRLVQEGRQVAAGESIARMGNSDTTDVMLHFEIRRNGKSIDPLQYLPNR